jgi:hypothetical protein
VLKVTLYKDAPQQVQEMKEKFGAKFAGIRFSNLTNWLGLRGTQKKVPKPGPCIYPFYQMQILWDGQITLCCHDSMEGFINMGNAKDQAVMDYWFGEKMQEVRSAHIRGDLTKLPVCDKCDVHLYEFSQESFQL